MYVTNLKVENVERADSPSGTLSVIATVTYTAHSRVVSGPMLGNPLVSRHRGKVRVEIDVLDVIKWLAPKAIVSKRSMTKVKEGIIGARAFDVERIDGGKKDA